MLFILPILGSWLVTLMTIGFVLTCLLLMLVILIQKPKGGGLSGAFGGAGGSAQAAFGAKTGDVLTWITVGFFIVFLLLAMGLTWAISAETATGRPALDPDGALPETTESVPSEDPSPLVPLPDNAPDPDPDAAAPAPPAPTPDPEPRPRESPPGT